MENISHQIAKHLRDVYLGGNWTTVHLKESLQSLTWQEATTQVNNFNTIAALVYHISYYVDGVLKVLKGGPLETKDSESFNHPFIGSQSDWNNMLENIWVNVEAFATEIESLALEKMNHHFIDEKYGNYYRNLHGIIEHTHYHLGQITLIKKMLQQKDSID